MHDILIIGGGYAGVWATFGAARRFDLASHGATIALVSRVPHLVARPRLYEYGLATTDACLPLAPIFALVGAQLIEGDVVGIDAAARSVKLADGRTLHARAIVLAAGSRAIVPPIPGLADHAEGIDDADQAARLWARLATVEAKPPVIAVIGGGFTGIELAAELAGWRDVRSPGARILLIDKGPIATGYAGDARCVIEETLRRLGIQCRPGATVTSVEADCLHLADGGRTDCDVAVWTGGLRPSSLTDLIAAPKDSGGRVKVDHTLRIAGLDGWFAAGDVAAAPVEDGNFTTMSCQHALSSGAFSGHNAAATVLGTALLDYMPRPYVTCLDLGPAGALRTMGFDRKLVAHGSTAKPIKRAINRQIIVPPVQGGRVELLAAGAPERWMAAVST